MLHAPPWHTALMTCEMVKPRDAHDDVLAQIRVTSIIHPQKSDDSPGVIERIADQCLTLSSGYRRTMYLIGVDLAIFTSLNESKPKDVARESCLMTTSHYCLKS